MKECNGIRGALAGIATASLLGFSCTVSALPITGTLNSAISTTYFGSSCTGTCRDLRSVGYDISGVQMNGHPENPGLWTTGLSVGVVSPATFVNGQYKTPGYDTFHTSTGDVPNVDSYNVTSKNNNPGGASNQDLVSNLDNMFSFYWGSIDNYNNIGFYKGNTLVTSINGNDIIGLLDGMGVLNLAVSSSTSGHNYGVDGYFSFSGGKGSTFDSVVLSSTQGVAFEYASVPEPGTLALFGLGLVGLGVMRRRKAG